MKKKTPGAKKLLLHRETLRRLEKRQLEGVAGGASAGTNCNTRIPCLTDLSCDRTCTC